MKYLKRLTWRTEEQRFNPLMHVFFFVTLVFGVGFTFFGDSRSVNSAVLHKLVAYHLGHSSAWGMVAIVITIANTIMLAFRNDWLARVVSMAGFMLWLFAAILYVWYGYWFQLLAICVPNMAFWGWYYLRVYAYQREVKNKPFE